MQVREQSWCTPVWQSPSIYSSGSLCVKYIKTRELLWRSVLSFMESVKCKWKAEYGCPLTMIMLQVVFGDPSGTANTSQVSSVDHLLTYSSAGCLTVFLGWGKVGMLPGAVGASQPMCLALGLLWSSSISGLFSSPQLEEDSCVQSSPFVFPDSSHLELLSQICQFPTQKNSSVFILTVHIRKLFGPSLLYLARSVSVL